MKNNIKSKLYALYYLFPDMNIGWIKMIQILRKPLLLGK